MEPRDRKRFELCHVHGVKLGIDKAAAVRLSNVTDDDAGKTALLFQLLFPAWRTAGQDELTKLIEKGIRRHQVSTQAFGTKGARLSLCPSRSRLVPIQPKFGSYFWIMSGNRCRIAFHSSITRLDVLGESLVLEVFVGDEILLRLNSLDVGGRQHAFDGAHTWTLIERVSRSFAVRIQIAAHNASTIVRSLPDTHLLA